jgi:hypothetical protein
MWRKYASMAAKCARAGAGQAWGREREGPSLRDGRTGAVSLSLLLLFSGCLLRVRARVVYCVLVLLLMLLRRMR